MALSLSEVEVDIFYQITQSQIDTVSAELTNLSKLSLFSGAELSEQIKAIEPLLVASSTGLIFRLVQPADGYCWELYGDYLALNNWLETQAIGLAFDYLLWPEMHHQPPHLLLFDMDSTFITIEVIDELAKRHQVGEKVAKVTEAAMQGELDFAESLVARVACLKGLSDSVINDIAKQLPLSKGVKHLVSQASRFNCKVAIVSGGFTPFVEKLKDEMGLYQVHANRLKITDGFLTGEVEGAIVDAKAKADFLQVLCQSLNITSNQAMAIGDGANDLLMMKEAGFNLAYRAKSKVQAEAKGRINQTDLGRLAGVFGWLD